MKLHRIDVYSKKLQKLPTPKYVVFYNGTKDEPDKRILKLSEAFENGDGCLECEATMLNINYGHNRELMEKCKKLQEYAIFVDNVRCHIREDECNLSEAIMRAIDECIEREILREILEKQKAEVLSLILSTFDRELYESNLKKDAYEEGKNDGISLGRSEGHNELLKNLVKKKLEKGKTVEQIVEELEQTEETIRKMIEELDDKN